MHFQGINDCLFKTFHCTSKESDFQEKWMNDCPFTGLVKSRNSKSSSINKLCKNLQLIAANLPQ